MSGYMPVGDVVAMTLQRALEGVGRQQQAIASNVANASTPGYRAQRVSFQESLAAALSRGDDPAAAAISTIDAGTPAKMDGNTVDLTSELTDMTRSQLLHESLVAATNFQLNTVRAALSR